MKLVGKPTASSGGAAGRSGVRGKPRAQAPEVPKNERFGVTRRSVAGKAGRCRSRGNLEPVSAGAAGGARPQGNLRLTHRRCRRIRKSGQLDDRSPAGPEGAKTGETRDASRGATGEIELRGNPELENRWKRRMDSRFRATWRSNAGKTRRCGVRGNLHPHQETLQEERDCGVTR